MIKTQGSFSKIINQRYHKKCIISGSTYSLDACHIIDKNICEKIKNNILKFHKTNGLLLRKDLHKTFDDQHWCFNPYDIKEEDDIYIKIGIIYTDIAPMELKSGNYYSIHKDSYKLICIRYTQFSCWNLSINIIDLQPSIKYINNIDNDGELYDIEGDTIMIDTYC